MKVVKWYPHLGKGVCELMCECGNPFYFSKNEVHNNGHAKCPSCPAIVLIKDVEGIEGENDERIKRD